MSENPTLPAAGVIGAEIMARAEEISAFSEDGPGVTRRFVTTEHRAASNLIMEWMRDAGMTAHLDAVGNTVGRYEGAEAGLPALLMGSHQDTVRHGGRYDGMLGVILPISCVKALNARGERLPFAIEIYAFGDEEGLRFHSTLLGSHALSGTFDREALASRDEDGITLDAAMRDFGLDPDAIAALERRPEDVLAFVETHIEQGPVLEAKDLPVGIVTAIAHGSRLAVTIQGEAGHAGTVPMGGRRDALTAASEAILAVERLCGETDALVGTVGKIAAGPGAVNVIPGEVSFSVDVRAPEFETQQTAVRGIRAEIEVICARRGVTAHIEAMYDSKGCACTPWVMDAIEAAVAAEGIAPHRLYSGAGHDAMAMVGLCAMGMLFVRCERGISHNPAEAITPADAGTAARVLLRFIRDFGKG